MYGVEHDKFHDIYNLVKWFRINDYSEEKIDDCISYIFERNINWRGIYEGYENGSIEDTRHLCPVCGKYEFEEKDSYDICPVCNWEDDGLQLIDPDLDGGANCMSLNEAREAYKNGLQVL